MGYPESDSEGQAEIAAFRDGLQKLGRTEGRNTRIDTRWAAPATRSRRIDSRRSWSRYSPTSFLQAPHPLRALVQETRTIPIVFAIVGDPIGSGFVASFPRPGGNVTGFNVSEPTQASKWVGLLREIAPGVARIAILFNPASATYAEYWLNPSKDAAAAFAVEAISAPVRDIPELDTVVAALSRGRNSGLIVMPDSFLVAHRAEITLLAARYRLPAVYPYRVFAEVGGLLSYGVDLTDNFRRAATYIDRILNGEKPSDLPVQAPVKLELVINLKTAKTLGLTIPPLLLATADELIE